jgi:Carboxypeptidase regulatory-like domain
MAIVVLQLLIYPNQGSRESFSQFSWHMPAGVPVRLTDRAGKYFDLVTGPGGVAKGELDDGLYKVSVPELDRFVVGNPDHNVGHPYSDEVRVFPANDYWLVPLRLTTLPTAGAPAAGVAGAKVKLKGAGGGGPGRLTFTSLRDGSVFAAWPAGDVRVKPMSAANHTPGQSRFIVRADQVREQIPVEYRPGAARITIRPELDPFGSGNAIPGVTFELTRDGLDVPLRQVTQGSQACVFSDLAPGTVTIRIIHPAEYMGKPIVLVKGKDRVSRSLAAGENCDLSDDFRFEYATGKLCGRIVDAGGQPVSDIEIVARSDGLANGAKSDDKGRYELSGLRAGEWTIMLAQSSVWVRGRTMIPDPMFQTVPVKVGRTAKAVDISLEPEEHGIDGQVRDEAGNPVPHATVEIRDQNMNIIDTVTANADGYYSWRCMSPGTFVVGLLRQDGETVRRQVVTVNSVKIQNLTSPSPPGGWAARAAWAAPTQPSPMSHADRESLIDLTAYPVMTEEVSTTGPAAPSAGGPGTRGPGAGYGQTVDQVIRDVLGWRPGGDVASFQAALTGAFQLREVEGHTEWSWQQRGYAVQADLGALTGAQASIYARASSALDQIRPLLAGLTTINPALFPQQDLEAIRTIVSTELQELVAELALEGGPRVQRVDELFALLLGASRNGTDLDPDRVDGQLGTLRDRFGLTVDLVNTVDEERIVTNFRVIVEQILSLFASWVTDRDLFSGLTAKTSFGTVLILLSRALEAVGESVDELTFALESVFIDAAQRQVITLRFAGLAVSVPSLPLRTPGHSEVTFGNDEPPILLSDLLDWVLRASRDEGRKIIQDAGKDGVVAFAPVLDKLRVLVHATQALSHEHSALPAALRTPRVRRALRELARQLDSATDLARSVQRQEPPEISAAIEQGAGGYLFAPPLETATTDVSIILLGRNFRDGATAALTAAGRPDLGEVRSPADLHGPSVASARFADPRTLGDGITWLISLTNSDGTHSNELEALQPKPTS